MAPKLSSLLNHIKVQSPLTPRSQSLTFSTAAYYELYSHWKRLVKYKRSDAIRDAINKRLIARVGVVGTTRGMGSSLLEIDDGDEDAEGEEDDSESAAPEAYEKAIAEFNADTCAQLAEYFAPIDPPSKSTAGQ